MISDIVDCVSYPLFLTEGNGDKILVIQSSYSISGITTSDLIDLLYSIGTIYTSMNSTDPSELFGGTWSQITDRFLYCADSSGSTGGSATLSEANLPAPETIVPLPGTIALATVPTIYDEQQV